MSGTQEKLLSAREAIAKLGISRPTLSRLQQKGSIGHYRIGVRVFFSERHISEFLAAHEQPANELRGVKGVKER